MALWWLAPAPLPGQNPPIKVEVPTVLVDVIVTDHKGHHVPGLTKDQFKVSEDNVPQEIVSFAPPGGGAASSADESTQQPSHATPGARSPVQLENHRPQSITLLIDLGDLQVQNLRNACQAAAQYVARTLNADNPENQLALYW